MNNINTVKAIKYHEVTRCVSTDSPEITSIIYRWSNDYDFIDEENIIMNSYGYTIKLFGTYDDDIDADTISMMISGIFFDTSYLSNKKYIIDFSELTYHGGDKFFNWYHQLNNSYIKSHIPTITQEPLFKKNHLILIVSNLCQDAITSIIEDDGIDELKDLCFDNEHDAIRYLTNNC